MYEVVRIKLEKTNAGVYARKSLFEQRSFRNRLAATKKVYPLPRKSLTLNEDVNCTILIQINHAIFIFNSEMDASKKYRTQHIKYT